MRPMMLLQCGITFSDSPLHICNTFDLALTINMQDEGCFMSSFDVWHLVQAPDTAPHLQGQLRARGRQLPEGPICPRQGPQQDHHC